MVSASTERVLVVHLTTACNLRCAYCFQRDKRPRALAWGPLRDALAWVLSAEGTSAHVAFTGGEPLLARPLLTRAVDFVEHERSPNLAVKLEILTNGLLLNDETVAFVADHDMHVSLSFDGRAPAQDLRGRGTFASLDALLARLVRARPFMVERRLRLAMTLCRQNVPLLADSVAYLLDTGAAHVSITPAMTPDDAWSDEDAAELDRQFAEVYRASLDRYERTGRVPLELFRKTTALEPAAEDAGKGSMCRIADGHALAVDVTGRAVPCSLFAEAYYAPGNPLLDQAAACMSEMGSVGDAGVSRRLAECGERLGALRLFGPRARKHSSRGRCADCEYLHRCVVCPVSIGLVPGNADPDRVPDFQCAFMRTWLAYRDRFPVQSPLEELRRGIERFWQSVEGRE